MVEGGLVVELFVIELHALPSAPALSKLRPSPGTGTGTDTFTGPNLGTCPN